MKEPLAEVILHQGRYWLIVRGVYLVMETDTCHDPAYDGPMWTPNTLRSAAADINSGRFGNAQERFKGKL